MDDVIKRVAQAHQVDISSLVASETFTQEHVAGFISELTQKFPADSHKEIDVVLLGSFARHDLTVGSDCDFLIVVDATVDPRQVTRMVKETNNIAKERGFKEPGPQGIFGRFVTAQELLARIGLDEDTNANLTRRVLLATESVSVFQPELRAKVIGQILRRYCADYEAPHREHDHVDAPHFLLNDLVRYWRTMAVDFGAKQWRDLRMGWFLRRSKLLITRKVLFAGSLAALFLSGGILRPHDGDPHDDLLRRLSADFERPPLARLLSLYDFVGTEAQSGLAEVLDAYAKFSHHLSRPATRAALQNPDAQLEKDIDRLTSQIQKGLEIVFFGDQAILPLTREYALF